VSGHEDDIDLRDWPTAPKTIEAIRAIVDNHACRVIDGVMVDAMSAQAIIAVYDALSEANRATFVAMPITRMGTVAWKLISKHNTRGETS
jgi:hypothetical protein